MNPTEAARRALIRALETAKLKTCRTPGDLGVVPTAERTAARHDCALCAQPIRYGELYVQKAKDKRAHYACVPGLGRSREPWQIEELRLVIPSGYVDKRAGLNRVLHGVGDEIDTELDDDGAEP